MDVSDLLQVMDPSSYVWNVFTVCGWIKMLDIHDSQRK